MTTRSEDPAKTAPPAPPVRDEADQIGQNIAAVHAFYAREASQLSHSQRLAERISRGVGQPAFLGLILAFVAAWIGANALRVALGLAAFDPPPYFWLQGILGLSALLITTVVLTKQNRVARLDEQRAHLDLKVMLLIEQKTAKMIDLLEELRRDSPHVRDRHDPDAAALQQAMNPGRVLAALDEPGPSAEATGPAAGASPNEPAAG